MSTLRITDITAALDRRSAPRLLLLFLGALFARGRRTVTSWFRPAGIRTDFRRGYAALWAGRGVLLDTQTGGDLVAMAWRSA